MPFPYYRRLSKPDKAIYRRSDQITAVPLPDAQRLAALAERIKTALETDDRRLVARAATILLHALFDDLNVPSVTVRVLATRPSSARSELHGLYVIEPGKRPAITVWMRTAARRDIVQYRTFLRTLMHEVCHHLDYALFGLSDSFHTHGFFRRESSLMRQLAPRGRASGVPLADAARVSPPDRRGQLQLPF